MLLVTRGSEVSAMNDCLLNYNSSVLENFNTVLGTYMSNLWQRENLFLFGGNEIQKSGPLIIDYMTSLPGPPSGAGISVNQGWYYLQWNKQQFPEMA